MAFRWSSMTTSSSAKPRRVFISYSDSATGRLAELCELAIEARGMESVRYVRDGKQALAGKGGDLVDESLASMRTCDAIVALGSYTIYGMTPESRAGSPADGRKSLCWIEVEGARQLGKPVFAFLPNPKVASVSKEELDSYGALSPVERTRLSDFHEFLCEDDACLNLFNGDEHLLELLDQCLDDLERGASDTPRVRLSHTPGESVIGRKGELARLAELLLHTEGQTAGIWGAIGVGKSELAAQFGFLHRDQFDRVTMVHCRGLTANQVAHEVAKIHACPEDADSDVRPNVLLDRVLADRRNLLILDDVDSVELGQLQCGGRSSMLVTAQRATILDGFGVDSDARVEVGALKGEAPLALLRSFVGSELVDREPDAAAELAGLLHGLPRAIRFAGQVVQKLNRSSVTPIAAAIARLSEAGRLRKDALETLALDSRTLGLAFTAAYEELDEEAKRALNCFAAFDAAGFTRAAAHISSDLPEQVLDDKIAYLVDAALLDFDRTARVYRMQPWWTAFVAASMDLMPTLDAAKQRLQAHYRDFTPEPAPGTAPVDASMREAEREVELLIAGRLVQSGERLSPQQWGGLRQLLERSGDWEGAARLCRECLQALPADAKPAVEAELRLRLGGYERRTGRVGAAIEQLEAAVAIYERVGFEFGLGAALNSLGRCYQLAGKTSEAIHALERSLALDRKRGRYNVGVAMALHSLGRSLQLDGQRERAIDLLEESAKLGEALKDNFHRSLVYNSLSRAFLQAGRTQEALFAVARGLVMADRDDNRRQRSLLLQTRGQAESARGDHDAALEAYAESARLAESLSDPRLTFRARSLLAHAHLTIGDYESGKAILQRCVAEAQSPKNRRRSIAGLLDTLKRTGTSDDVLDAWATLLKIDDEDAGVVGKAQLYVLVSTLLRGIGKHKLAQAAAERAVDLGRVLEDPHGLSISLHALAVAKRDGGDPRGAVQVLREVLDIEGLDPANQAYVLNSLGRMLAADDSRGAEAEDVLRKCIELERQQEDRGRVAYPLLSLGNMLLRDLGRGGEWRELLFEARQVEREHGTPRGEAMVCHALAVGYRLRGKLDEAEEAVRASIEIGRTRARDRHLAQTLRTLGLILADAGRLDKAFKALRESADIGREIGDEAHEVRALVSLGKIQWERVGDAEEAAKVLERGLRAAGNDPRSIAAVARPLARVYRALDDSDAAIGTLDRARSAAETIAREQRRCWVLGAVVDDWMGLLDELGRTEEILDLLRASLEVGLEVSDWNHVVRTARREFNRLIRSDREAEAVGRMKASVEAAWVQDGSAAIRLLAVWAEWLAETGRLDELVALFDPYASRFRSEKRARHGASLLRIKASRLHRERRSDEALAAIQAAQSWLTEDPDPIGEQHVLRLLSRILVSRGDLDGALAALRAAPPVAAADDPLALDFEFVGLLRRANRSEEAAKLLRDIIASARREHRTIEVVRATVLLAPLLSDQRLDDEALDALAVARQVAVDAGLRSHEAGILEARGRVEERRRKLDEAEACYRSALQIRRSGGDDARLSHSLRLLGRFLRKRRSQPEEAATLLQEAMVVNERLGHLDAYFRAAIEYGAALKDAEQLDEAIRVLDMVKARAAVEDESAFCSALTTLASAYGRQGKRMDQKAELEQARSLLKDGRKDATGTYLAVLRSLGACHHALREGPKAVAVFEDLLERVEDNPRARLGDVNAARAQLAGALRIAGREREALNRLSKRVAERRGYFDRRRDERNAKWLLGDLIRRADALMSLGRPAEALRDYEGAEELWNGFALRGTPYWHVNGQARAHSRLGQSESADNLFARAGELLSANDVDRHAHFNSLQCEEHGLAGRFAEAIACGERALVIGAQLDEAQAVLKRPYARTFLARALLGAGRKGEALAMARLAFQDALRAPGYEVKGLAALELARVLVVSGELDQAREILDRADAWIRRSGLRKQAVLRLALLGAVCRAGGAETDAADFVVRSRELHRELHDEGYVLHPLDFGLGLRADAIEQPFEPIEFEVEETTFIPESRAPAPDPVRAKPTPQVPEAPAQRSGRHGDAFSAPTAAPSDIPAQHVSEDASETPVSQGEFLSRMGAGAPAPRLELGQLVRGRIREFNDNGAIVEVGPGAMEFCHFFELAHGWARGMPIPFEVGEELVFRVIDAGGERGGVRLSHKALQIDALSQAVGRTARGTVECVEGPFGVVRVAPSTWIRSHFNEIGWGTHATFQSLADENAELPLRLEGLNERGFYKASSRLVFRETLEQHMGAVFRGRVVDVEPRRAHVRLAPGVVGGCAVTHFGNTFIDNLSSEIAPGAELLVRFSGWDKRGFLLLSRRDALEASADSIVGQDIEGTVVNVNGPFVFLRIAPGVQGACHVREFSDRFVSDLTQECDVGDRLRARVTGIRAQQNRLLFDLSCRQAGGGLAIDVDAVAGLRLDQLVPRGEDIEPYLKSTLAALSAPEVDGGA